jgi:hypothetical protein
MLDVFRSERYRPAFNAISKPCRNKFIRHGNVIRLRSAQIALSPVFFPCSSVDRAREQIHPMQWIVNGSPSCVQAFSHQTQRQFGWYKHSAAVCPTVIANFLIRTHNQTQLIFRDVAIESVYWRTARSGAQSGGQTSFSSTVAPKMPAGNRDCMLVSACFWFGFAYPAGCSRTSSKNPAGILNRCSTNCAYPNRARLSRAFLFPHHHIADT